MTIWVRQDWHGFGMDVENYTALGIDETFAENQRRVLAVFEKLGIITTCSCTPYLFGNLPCFGEHIAWAESSAVCYANSVLGARSNREGGPSALAASLTGRTPAYGYHQDAYRQPTLHVEVKADVLTNPDFGALGKAIGDHVQADPAPRVPYITGIQSASLENLKSFCASIATSPPTVVSPFSTYLVSHQNLVLITHQQRNSPSLNLNLTRLKPA